MCVMTVEIGLELLNLLVDKGICNRRKAGHKDMKGCATIKSYVHHRQQNS